MQIIKPHGIYVSSATVQSALGTLGVINMHIASITGMQICYCKSSSRKVSNRNREGRGCSPLYGDNMYQLVLPLILVL